MHLHGFLKSPLAQEILERISTEGGAGQWQIGVKGQRTRQDGDVKLSLYHQSCFAEQQWEGTAVGMSERGGDGDSLGTGEVKRFWARRGREILGKKNMEL